MHSVLRGQMLSIRKFFLKYYKPIVFCVNEPDISKRGQKWTFSLCGSLSVVTLNQERKHVQRSHTLLINDCQPRKNNSSESLCYSHLTDKSSRWEDPPGRGGSATGDGPQGNGSSSNIPSLLSMATRSHMDITTPPLPQVGDLQVSAL